MTDALRAELDSRGKRYLVRAADGSFAAVNHAADGDLILYDATCQDDVPLRYERISIWEQSQDGEYVGWVAKFSDGAPCDQLYGVR